MELYTIGFTQTTAESFFGTLKRSGATRVVDVRLNNVSQLAGFAKRNDLQYFLQEICGMGYVHLPELAPTQDMLDAYKKHKGDWDVYADRFLELMRQREVERRLDPDLIAGSCLLCSERQAHRCHRRLVAEYLQQHWGDVAIRHL